MNAFRAEPRELSELFIAAMDFSSLSLVAPRPHPPAAARSSQSWHGVLASIDMGSNSFRLEIGRISHGRYRRLDYLKEPVQLGAGLDAQGALQEEAMQRALACLTRFRHRLGGMPTEQLRAVATQTLREATNREGFLKRAQSTLGHPIEVISGREEARLIYKGVTRLQPTPNRRLVIDIGGRSTEIILGQGPSPLVAESFPVGCVSMTQRYFPDGVMTEARFQAAQIAAEAEFEEALKLFSRDQWLQALGASGTAASVSEVLQASGFSPDGRITLAGLRWCREACIAAEHPEGLQLPGLPDDRRAVLGGGVAILSALLQQFEIDALYPAQGALRQGLIFDLDEHRQSLRDLHHPDLRDDTVNALQRRFHADTAQAHRVQTTALRLLRQLYPQASVDQQRKLCWAAALHEIGVAVSHHDHHHHGSYLIQHADAAGFSQTQQQRLACLVRGQRGGLRKIETVLQQDAVLVWQLLALRLAVVLCHTRTSLDDSSTQAELVWAVAVTPQCVTVHATAAWAQQHPRTLHQLRQESDHWAKTGLLHLQVLTQEQAVPHVAAHVHS